jgi:hypothetical protein
MGGKPKAAAKENKKTKRAPESDPQAGKETLLLWAILGAGGEKCVSRVTLTEKGMLPGEDKKARDGLEKRGLITVKPPLDEHGRPARGIWMTVTKTGLTWAEENLAVMPAKTQAATPILQAWPAAAVDPFTDAQHIDERVSGAASLCCDLPVRNRTPRVACGRIS